MDEKNRIRSYTLRKSHINVEISGPGSKKIMERVHRMIQYENINRAAQGEDRVSYQIRIAAEQ